MRYNSPRLGYYSSTFPPPLHAFERPWEAHCNHPKTGLTRGHPARCRPVRVAVRGSLGKLERLESVVWGRIGALKSGGG